VREYPWGVVEPLRSRHSDMAVLKKLLFEESFVTLKQETERRYYMYRQREIGDGDLGGFG
jgi:septin family protein